MKPNYASKTAEATAAVRASHTLYDRPVVFDDGVALELTSPIWRSICRIKMLHKIIVKGVLRKLRPVHGLVIARSRYTENELEKAIQNGLRQYVIIGAGFDSFALRRGDLSSSVRTFELDHPASQRVKIQRITKRLKRFPTNLEFVPVDFENNTVADALIKSSANLSEPIFFSWLGTTFYLSNDAIRNTLESISAVAAPGSQLIFDYLLKDDCVPIKQRTALVETKRFAMRRGENVVSCFEPDSLVAEVEALGYKLVRRLTEADQNSEFFPNRSDDLVAMPGSGIAHFRIQTPRLHDPLSESANPSKST